ncbi:MAG TPA: BON domain-containing protein [Gammaproteobacteria bacterium]|nr:BON domain-containing protein [Gammaproteobacteria bacterium]
MRRTCLLIPLLVLFLTACAPTVPPVPDDYRQRDPVIKEQVLQAIHNLNVMSLDHVTVTVNKGIVDLNGYVYYQSEISQIGDAARAVDGVRALRNHLFVPSRGGGSQRMSL